MSDPLPVRAAGHDPQGSASTEGGFGLVETIVAFTVLLLVLVAVGSLAGDVLGQAATARAAVTAGGLAEQTLGQLAHEPLSSLSTQVDRSVSLPVITLAGETFSRQEYLAWQAPGTPDLCQSGQPPVALLATVTVAWDHDRQHLSQTSVLDPPYSAQEAGDGDLAVAVQSAADPSQPPADVQAVRVLVSTPDGQQVTSATPDPSGCVYLTLPAGSYEVSLQSPTAPLFVDPAGQEQTPAQQVTVAAGQVSQLAVSFDQATLVTFQPSPLPSSSTPPPPPISGLPVTVTSSGLPTGSAVIIPAGQNPSGPVPLFPFPTGYHAYYGDCPAEAPANPTGFSTAPGAVDTVDLSGLEPLELQVSATGAGPVTGTLQLDPSASSGCPADSFPLGPLDLQHGSGLLSAQVLPLDSQVTLQDQADGASTSLGLSWDPSSDEWLVSQGGTTTPFSPSQPIPVQLG